MLAATIRAVGALPPFVHRALAGPPCSVDGDVLESEAQFWLRLGRVLGTPAYEELGVERARELVVESTRAFRGRPAPLARVTDVDAGGVPARLYEPFGVAPDGPLLVYFHGGGWVLGSVDTHDRVARFLARETPLRVLSVDYRLAPEHRFPAAYEDALTAFRWASTALVASGVAVGGDSAGGNLAAGVALAEAPAMQLLLYPVCDVSRKHPSYARFGQGYYLTERTMDWYRSHYLPDEAAALDPRASPLLAPDLSDAAPAYVAVAGFDPLRDEGLAYAERLRSAGVSVDVRLHRGQVHAFANTVGVGRRAPAALREAAAALRARLL